MNRLRDSCDSLIGKGAPLRRHAFATPVALFAPGWLEYTGRAHMRLRTILPATTLLLASTFITSAFAQTPILPSDQFRKPAAQPVSAPAQAAKPAAPKRAVASFWTSSEPTFDEGTYDRINAAMLSYSAIEVRGGVRGAIRAANVMLHPTAQVDGEITHQTLSISEGAQFDGRVRRAKDALSLIHISEPTRPY